MIYYLNAMPTYVIVHYFYFQCKYKLKNKKLRINISYIKLNVLISFQQFHIRCVSMWKHIVKLVLTSSIIFISVFVYLFIGGCTQQCSWLFTQESLPAVLRDHMICHGWNPGLSLTVCIISLTLLY